MSKIHYSVVMPVYLREPQHKETVITTINSIKDSSSNYELIIVDDGSPLDAGFLRELSDVFIKNENNAGISVSWNKGMLKAQARYVAIVNDDIKVPTGWLDKLRDGFSTQGAGVTAPMKGGPNTRPSVLDIEPIKNHKFYPGYCFMLDKNVFYEPFDEQFRTNCGDTDYWHRIRESGLGCVRVGLNVWHKEGGVLHGMDYAKISADSINKFIKKHGFNPQKEYYG